jgi:tight adherence protein C
VLSPILEIGYFILLAIAASMAIFHLLPDFDRLKLSRRFHDELEAGRKPPALLNLFRIPILLFEDFAMSLKVPGTRIRYEHDLRSLGLDQLVTVDQLIALRVTLIAIFMLYGLMLLGSLPFFFCAALPLFGWFFVDMWLRDKIRERKRKIKVQLPFVLDTLCLSVEAGLDFGDAIIRIVERLEPSPLRDELTIYLRQTKVGTGRPDALKNLALRTDVPQISSMVTALIQASKMGTSIGIALRTQSEIMNSERFTEAEKKGAEASQKLLVPMMLFIVPAIMIILIGPTLLAYIYGRAF